MNEYKGQTTIRTTPNYNFLFDIIDVDGEKLIMKSSHKMLHVYEYLDGEDDAYKTKHIQSGEEEEKDGVFIEINDEKKLAIISMYKNGKSWAFEFEDGTDIGHSVGMIDTDLNITIYHSKIKDLNFDDVVDLTDVLKDALWEGDVTYEGLELDDVFRKSLYIY